MKPRARCHTSHNGPIWSVWSEIATGFGITLEAAYQGWQNAAALHQMQYVSPRERWTPHYARWFDC